ncbi:SDR family NAD(P)-dependent oxidoreductase [Paraglaciecola hydrolytica]|uniref:3-oxoacyl-ACP reductase n=1 Tax=Paraglaciecola hydrolytica TaxID=1799789 RepID=A0A135ZYK2_9ALTE|nr:SDR family oxidoreductase [Paraglaciecola hydrolytica]KXI28041.1 3-oxoacyl-ACP reductase [Paraglaciecola hydrolytica]
MSANNDQINQYPSLKHRHVFITGGATGIGAELVRAFYQQGAFVSFIDIDEPASQQLCADITGSDRQRLQYFMCDIRNIPQLLETIHHARNQFGDVSVLVNNAANDARHDTETLSVEYWDDQMAVNLRPNFFTAQAVVAHMKRLGGGSIINLGSISWRIKQDFMPVYTTAKAALEGMTRTLAKHHGRDNIRVNTLIPGWVMTEKQISHRLQAGDFEDIRKNQCIKETLEASHIASAALFLASDDSKMITAQSIIVDGGWV